MMITTLYDSAINAEKTRLIFNKFRLMGLILTATPPVREGQLQK